MDVSADDREDDVEVLGATAAAAAGRDAASPARLTSGTTGGGMSVTCTNESRLLSFSSFDSSSEEGGGIGGGTGGEGVGNRFFTDINDSPEDVVDTVVTTGEPE